MQNTRPEQVPVTQMSFCYLMNTLHASESPRWLKVWILIRTESLEHTPSKSLTYVSNSPRVKPLQGCPFWGEVWLHSYAFPGTQKSKALLKYNNQLALSAIPHGLFGSEACALKYRHCTSAQAQKTPSLTLNLTANIVFALRQPYT